MALGTILTSVLALLVWLAVLAFLAKWFQAWAVGHLQPGVNTSWAALKVLFLLAFLASASGIFLSVRAWRGKSHLKEEIGDTAASPAEVDEELRHLFRMLAWH